MVEENDTQVTTAPLEEPEDEPPTPTGEKNKKLNVRLSELEEAAKNEKTRAEDLFKRLQYLQADFDNYRRRVEKEITDARRYGNERLLLDLLVVNDEMELALAEARESGENPVFLEGVEMVLKRLSTILSKEGVERIPGVGTKFNPELHEAALRVSSDEDDGTIVEEIRSGYTLKGRVLRPSIVKVSEKQSNGEISKEDSKE
jgi:molecular chaperone GrpE